MAAAPAVELELDYLVWKDKNGTERVTPAHTFASGTMMLFQQSTAPVGWTKSTTHNNKALRIVSGSVSTGGNHAFTTAFASKGVSGSVSTSTSTSVSIGNWGSSNAHYMPSHRHIKKHRGGYGGTQLSAGTGWGTVHHQYTEYTGGNGSHKHSASASSSSSSSFRGSNIDMRVQYVDFIIAQKD